MPHVNKAKYGLTKWAPLGVKGDEFFDWVNQDQINNAFLEEWQSMRHNVVLVGGGSCEKSYFIEMVKGFCKLSNL